MFQELPAIPRTLSQWIWLALATSIGYAVSSLNEWIKRKRSPAEEAKTTAEARQIHVSTDLSLMQAASEALTKALHLQDRCNLLERKVATLEQKVVQAEDDARAAEMFTEQLNMAAKLAGVRLQDFSPRQLEPPE